MPGRTRIGRRRTRSSRSWGRRLSRFTSRFPRLLRTDYWSRSKAAGLWSSLFGSRRRASSASSAADASASTSASMSSPAAPSRKAPSFRRRKSSTGQAAQRPTRGYRKTQRLHSEALEPRTLLTSFNPNDLAVLVAAASASNTTGSIVELNTATPSQNAVQTISISGAGTDAYRLSGSATSTGYLTLSNDHSLLAFTGANSTDTASNVNTLNPRGVFTVNVAGSVVKQTTYTGVSGDQTRSASTLNNSNWFIGDQGGFYTNNSALADPVGNIRSVKTFGGVVYAFTASTTSPPVGTIATPTGGTFTALPGLANGDVSKQDFYLIASGDHGSTYDVLYVLTTTSATAGSIAKFSLVDTNANSIVGDAGDLWTANGSTSTSFGGFGLAAADDGNGAALYVTSGTGATTNNSVIKLFDAAGYNSTINVNASGNVTLFTATGGAILKGLDFTPAASPTATVYVDDDFTGFAPGQAIADADPVTAGNQPAIFGVTAFATIQNAVAGIGVPGGTIVVNAGTYGAVDTDATPATLKLNGSVNFGALSGGPSTSINTNGNTLTVGSLGTDTTFSGVISGTGALTKVGGGKLTLLGSSTYTGITTVSGGTIAVGNSNALGAVSAVADVVVNGGAVDLGPAALGTITFGSKIFKISGSGIGGTGALTNSGQNTQLNAFNFITLTGDATIGGYRMDIGRVPAPATNGILDLQTHKLTVAMTANGVTTSANPFFSILDKVVVQGNGEIDVTSGTLGFENGSFATAANVSKITFESGSNLQLFRQTAGNITVPMTFMGNNIIGGGSNSGTTPTLNSPITLKGNIILEPLASGSPSPGSNNLLIIAGNISEQGGSFGVTQFGANTTTLAGVNSYTGPTTIKSGTLALDFSAATAPAANIISPSSSLIVGSVQPTGLTGNAYGGTLSITGKANSANSQTFIGTALDVGPQKFTATSGAGGSVVVNLGSISRVAGSAAIFTNPASGNFTTTNALVAGILGGWATIGNDWATANTASPNVDGSFNIIPYSAYTAITTGAITSDSNSNLKYGAASTGNLTAATGTLINSLIDGHTDANNRTLTITGTMKVGPNGGIFRSSTASNNFTVTGGTLSVNGGGNLFLYDAPFTATGNNLTVASVIANDGANPVTLNVVGYVNFTQSAANTLTGNTYVIQGRVQSGRNDNFGAGDVYIFPGGQVFFNNGNTYANNFFISGTGSTEQSGSQDLGAIRMSGTSGTAMSGVITLLDNARISGGSGANNTITGRITGPGRLEFTASTGNNGSIILGNTSATPNDWSGGLQVTVGNSGRQVFLKLGASNQIPDGAGKGDVTLNGTSSTASLDLNGFSEIINGLIAAASTNNQITNTGGAASTLTVGGNNATASYGGTIANGTNALNIVKSGTGTQTLTGANTYTGTTTINAGALVINGTHTGGGAYTVNSTGSLGGTGTITASVSVGSGGTLSPGTSPGKLTINGNVALAAGAIFSAELNGTAAGTSYDQLAVTGTGTVDITGATLNLSGSFVAGGGESFTLIDKQSAGAITGTFAGLAEGSFVTLNGRSYKISYVGGDGNDVVLTANTPAALVANSPSVTVPEGTQAQNSGTFNDANGETVTLTASVGTVNQVGTSSGTWTWSYTPADGPSSQVVTIFSSDGHTTTTTSFNLIVNNVAPSMTGAMVSSSTVNEGDQITLTFGSIADPGTDTISGYRVNWGDGSNTGILAGVPTGTISHTYADDNPTGTSSDVNNITIDLVDEDGTYLNAANPLSVTVNNLNPSASITGAPANSPEGTQITLGSGVIDLGVQDTFTYAWSVTKDGNPFGTGTNPTFSFTPDDNGSYVVSLTVTDDDTGAGVATPATISVTNANPTATISNNGPVNEGTAATVTLSGGSDASSVDQASLHYYFSLSQAARDAAAYADGTTTNNQAFLFGQDGSYTVYARVIDKDGGFNDYQTTVVVNNVAPVANDDAGSVTEDGPITATGNVLTNDTDVAADLPLHVATGTGTGIAGTYGTLDLAANGAYTYTLNNSSPLVQALAAGQQVTDSFNYTATDGADQSNVGHLVITITGKNDVPVANDDGNSVAEDGTLVATGNVLSNDQEVDTNDSLSVVATYTGGSIAGTYGTLSLASNGAYTYTLNNAGVQFLAQNQQVTDVFDYKANDGHVDSNLAHLTITITGANDPPVANNDGNNVAEDGTLVATGNVLANDQEVDTNDSLSVVATYTGGSLAGTYGTLSLASNGAYTYTLNNAGVQFLAQNQQVTDVFDYKATDGLAQSNLAHLTITITGANDAPVATNNSNSLTEDTLSVSGNVLTDGTPDSDVDTGTVLTVAAADTGTNIAGTHGSLNLASNGSYTYTLNTAGVQQLKLGESVQDQFTYHAFDGIANSNAATLTITINGLNDNPVAEANGPYSIVEGEDVTLSAAGSAVIDGGTSITNYHWVIGTIAGHTYTTDSATPSVLISGATLDAAGIDSLNSPYTVALTVTDNRGFTGGDTATLNVASASNVVGTAGNDTLVIDLTTPPGKYQLNGGTFHSLGSIPVLTFDGAAGSDKIVIQGNGQTAVYTPGTTAGGNGSIVIGGLTINFSNLEPVDMSGFASVTVASPANAANSLTLSAGFDSTTNSIPALVVSGNTGLGMTGIESAHLWNNGSVTIDTSATTGAGANNIAVSGAISASHNNVNITLKTNSNGSITFNGDVAASGAIVLTTPVLNLNADIAVAGKSTSATTFNVGDPPGLDVGHIQDAIDLASAGATINVGAGTFTENLTLAKQVFLKGAQAGVDARGRVASESILAPAAAGTGTLILNASMTGTVIDGFTFSGGTSLGALQTQSGASFSGLQIINNRFTGYSQSAVFLNRGGSDIVINKNVLDGSSIAGSGQAIFMNGPQTFAGIQITNNNIVNNAGRYGIFVDGNHNVGESATQAPSISGNLFNNNLQSLNLGSRSFGTLGAPVTGLYGGYITGNTFSNNTANGIQAGIQHVLVSGNTFSGNTLSGLVLTSFGNAGVDRGAQNSVITQNTFSGNGSEDLFFSASQAAGTISTNSAFGNSFGSNTAVTYNGTETINASGNWWGSATGPTVTGHPTGTGKAIGGTGAANVDFTPWLNSGSDTSGAAGFQGSFSSITVSTDGAQSGATGRVTEGIADVTFGGTLKVLGGTYTENVDATTNSVVFSPGASPAQVFINGNLTFDNNDTLVIELNGTNPSTQFDNLVVSGTVALGGATLTVSRGFFPAVTDSFVIINKTSAGGISGAFNGLPQNATIDVNGIPMKVSYIGGDSNDVQLSVVQPNEVWVDDNWQIAPGGDLDNSGTLTNGDIVQNTGAGDSSTVFGKVYGYNAFSTIQAGVAAVPVGGTVDVLAGNYALAAGMVGLSIAQNVHIVGEGDTGPFIAHVNASAAFTGIEVQSGVTDASISGIELSNFASTGVHVLGNLTLSHSTISGGFVGVWADGASSVLNMQSALVSGALIFGVQVSSGANATIGTSEILGNGATAASVIVSGGHAAITGSILTGSNRGVLVNATGTASIHGSNLTGNSVRALENASANIVDASDNWWGFNTEASVQAQTLGLVDFTPYLFSGTDLDGGARGFGADNSHVVVTSLGQQTGAVGRIGEAVSFIANGTLTGANRLVDVNNGAYSESNILVDRPVIIHGQSQAGVVVSPNGVDSHDDSNYGGTALQGFVVNSGGVTIDHLTLDGGAGHNFRNGVLADTDNGWTGSLTVDHLTINNIFRKGIGLYGRGTNHTTGNQITNNTFDHIGDTLASFEAVFAITSFQSDATITGNTITHSAAGIGSNYLNTEAQAPQLIVHDNSFSLPITAGGISAIGLDLSGLANGSDIHDNIINTSGGSGHDLGVVIQYAATGATVSLHDNAITVDGGDTGILLYQNSDLAHPTLVDHNTITGSSAATGILVTDDGAVFGEAPHAGTTYATITRNTISGFATGIAVVGGGSNPVHATIGGTPADDNSITGSGHSGTGVLVTGSNASGDITGNNASIHGFAIGVDVNGGSATISGDHIYDNTTGVRFTGGGSGSLSSDNFVGPADNGTDVRLDSSAGTVTFGNNNLFAGDTYYIDNRSSQNIDLSAVGGTTFDVANNFRIEDHMFHKVDNLASGLITWVANQIYVTTPGSLTPGSTDTDSSIQRGIDAVPGSGVGWTVNVEAGTYNENVTVNKSVTVLGQGSGVAGTVLSITSGNGFTIAADGVTLQALRVAGTGATNGIYIDSAVSNDVLTDVVATGNHTGLEIHNSGVASNLHLNQVSLINGTNGLRISTTGQIHGLTVVGGHFDNNDYGWEVEANSGSTSNQTAFTGVNVSGGTTFNNDQFKGIYVEKLDNATFDGIVVSGSGYGASSPAGIDINLKYGTYAGGITIQNSTLTNNGTGVALPNPAAGVGLTIKARNDAPSYNSNPASLTNVHLTNLSITGSPVDMSVGNNVSGVVFSNVDLLGAGVGLINYTTALGTLQLADTDFAGSLQAYIINSSANGVDAASGATFNGFNTSAGTLPADLPTYFAIVDKIADGVDAPGPGLVRLLNGHVFVTTNSFANLGVAPFTTTSADIQRAVNVASPLDVVHVANGTYVNQVEITKNITLLGQSQAGAIIQSPASLPLFFTTSAPNHPVVYVHNTTATIQNLTVDGNGQGGGGNNRITGIAYRNASGTVDSVTVEHVRQTPLNGVQEGTGIFVSSDGTSSQNVAINAATVFDFQKNGITIDGNNLTANVTGSTVTGAGPTTLIAQNGIQVSNGAVGHLTGDIVSNINYTPFTVLSVGILLFNAGSGTSVSGGNVHDNQTGIYAAGTNPSVSISGVTASNNTFTAIGVESGTYQITNNTISGAGQYGIYVNDAFPPVTADTVATITGNAVHGVGTAVEVVDFDVDAFAVKATIDGNNLTGNTTGIDVDAGIAKIQNNDLRSNHVGIHIIDDGRVDAGSLMSDPDITGLGHSSGNNLLSGYTGASGNYAIEDRNLDVPNNIDVYAKNNNFGTGVPSAIELVVFHTVDDPQYTQVFFTPAINPQSPVPPNEVWVDDNWVGVGLGTDADLAHTDDGTAFGYDQFATIQDAINAVAVGGLIHVRDGSYKENVDVTKSVTISGAGEGVVTVYPGASNPQGGSLGSPVFLIDADNVTIQGLTVDGNNPMLTSGVVVAGQDIDASTGIITNWNSPTSRTGITIKHVTVQNVYLRGIEYANGNDFGTGVIDFENDTVTNVQGDPASIGIFNFGGHGTIANNTVSFANDGIADNWSFGTEISGNTITHSGSGVHTDNNGGAGGVADNIHDNHVSLGGAGSYGIFVFVPYVNVSVHDNVVSTVDVGLADFGGFGGTATFTNNTVSVNAGGTGALVTTDTLGFGQMNVNATFSGGSFSGGATGISVVQNAGATATTSISGVTIDDPAIGIDVNGGSATISGGHIFNNGTGIRFINGGTGSVSGVNFDDGGASNDNGTDLLLAPTAGTVTIGSNNHFAGDTFFIDDQTSQSFNLVGNGTTFDESNNYRIEDKMHHRVDTNLAVTNGLITWVTGNVFVTDGGTDHSIQRGVDAVAAPGDTVNVEHGTYVEAVTVNKAIVIDGEDFAPTPTATITAPATGVTLINVTDTNASDNITIRDMAFAGVNGGNVADLGVNVPTSANFATLTVDHSTFTGLHFNGIQVLGNSTTGISAHNVVVNNSTFTNNGFNNGGAGDIDLFNYNGNASLTHLVLTNNGALLSRQGIQMRGVGNASTGVGALPMGTVLLDDIDVSGSYRTSFVTFQVYATANTLTLHDVKLGGATSKILGGFGALLRFDEVGGGTPSSPATVNLGNTYFRGLDPTSPQKTWIEFAPDNTFAFLKADATGTFWDLTSGTHVAAASLTPSQAFEIEDHILDYVDPDNAGQYYKGWAQLQNGNAFVTATSPVGVDIINRGIEMVNAGGTVYASAGTYAQGVSVNKQVTLRGAQFGVSAFGVAHNADRVGGESVVTDGIDVLVDGVTIDGFKLAGADGVGDIGTGIYLHGGNSGQTVINNIFRANTFGLYLNSNGATPTLVQNNLFDTNTVAGPASGNGIYSDQNAINVTVDHNKFIDNDLTFGATATTVNNQVHITSNTIVGGVDGGEMTLLKLTNSNVTGNTITNSPFSSIALAGGNNGVTLSGNTITGSASNGINVAGDVFSVGFAADQNIIITGNTISGGVTGVLVKNGSSASIDNSIGANSIHNNTTGIKIDVASSGTILGGHVFDNTTGIVVLGTAKIDGVNLDVGNGTGVNVDGGTALVQNTNFNDNTIGLLIQHGGIVDAGQTGKPVTNNFTGLGISTGNNDFTGFTATATATSGAVVDLNANGPNANPGRQGPPYDATAYNNLWHAPVTVNSIENVIYHDSDDPNLGFVDFAAFGNLSVSVDQNNINEGQSVTLSGSFTNVPQQHTVTISWGDGSPNTVLTLPSGTFNFSTPHTYADDANGPPLFSVDNITVTVQDTSASPPLSDNHLNVTVNDVAPTVALSGPNAAGNGQIKHYTFTTSDPGDDNRTPGQLSLSGIVVNTVSGGATGSVSNIVFDPVTGNGSFDVTFSNPPGGGSVSIQVTVADDDGAAGMDSLTVNVANTLQVIGFTQTASGFDVTFNRAPNLGDINLYDGLDAPVETPDVIVHAVNANVDVRGSLVWHAATNTFSFVKTGGILANDTYNVTLISGNTAFHDAFGKLDGDSDFNDTEVPDNYTNSFVVNVAAGTRVVSVKDFARGPGQHVDDNPAVTLSRLAVSVNDATNLRALDFHFNYDPTQLNIVGASLGPSVPGDWIITFSNSISGEFVVTASGITPLSGSNVPVVLIDANVPSTALYGNSDAMFLSNLVVKVQQPGPIVVTAPSIGDIAVHKTAYLGDADASGKYTGFDAALISRVVAGLDSGFDAHDWTDPLIVGDADGDGMLGGGDAAVVAQKSVNLPTPQIPNVPNLVLTPVGGGIDPQLSIPDNILVSMCSLTVPVNISIPASEMVYGTTFNVTYATNLMDFESAARGSFWTQAAGWGFVANESTPGVVTITLFNSQGNASAATPVGNPQNIANLVFHVHQNANVGLYDISAVSVDPNDGGLTWTHDDGTVKVMYSPAYLSGDTDGDFHVNLSDLNNVINHFGGTGLGDTDCDNDIDLADLNNVINGFGQSLGGPGSGSGGGSSSEEVVVVGGSEQSAAPPAGSPLMSATASVVASNATNASTLIVPLNETVATTVVTPSVVSMPALAQSGQSIDEVAGSASKSQGVKSATSLSDVFSQFVVANDAGTANLSWSGSTENGPSSDVGSEPRTTATPAATDDFYAELNDRNVTAWEHKLAGDEHSSDGAAAWDEVLGELADSDAEVLI